MTSAFDPATEVLRVLTLEGQSILDCAKRLQNTDSQLKIRKALQLLQDSLTQGGKIVVTGIGKSGKVGQKIAATLSSTGSLAVFLHPTEGLHGDLGVISPKDVIIALSYTGNTEELLRLVPSFKNLKVPMISICGNAQSKLALASDVWVDASVEQEACPHNLAPTSSTTLALAIGDALAMALMRLRGFMPENFALNHPGGSLGKKLNLRVEEVMHGGKDLPWVLLDASMDDVLLTSTRHKLGAVLVVNSKSELLLQGIITDGDIRRALQHREKFFQMKAGEVMTANPVTVTPELLAKAALDLMENRPSQISVLPVVDSGSGGKVCVGVVRLHDLVRAF